MFKKFQLLRNVMKKYKNEFRKIKMFLYIYEVYKKYFRSKFEEGVNYERISNRKSIHTLQTT